MPIDPSKVTLMKIVSGGQTGVDRGAMDAALAAEFPCGGWCPEGRQSEDGRIPDKYPLLVLEGSGYRQRTLKNVEDSDGTLILFNGSLTGGTKLTRDLCVREKKAFFVVDATLVPMAEAIDGVRSFIVDQNIRVLNVAGPRASGWGRGHQFAFEVICGTLRHLAFAMDLPPSTRAHE